MGVDRTVGVGGTPVRSVGGDGGGGEGRGGECEGEEEEGRSVSVVERLFGCTVESVSVCQCGWTASRRSTELHFSLTYPRSEWSCQCVLVYALCICIYIYMSVWHELILAEIMDLLFLIFSPKIGGL